MPVNVDNINTEILTLNFGPQHPSAHGVYRAVLGLDGEYVVSAENVIGYLHRGIEKIAETRTYAQFTPYTSRLDYLAGMLNNLGYIQTIEKLMEVEVPQRAEYIRIIMSELQRIASHLVMIASLSIDLSGITGWIYAFSEREKILDLFEMVGGSRLTTNYIRIGGVAEDLTEEFIPALKKLLNEIPKRLDEFEELITGNEIFIGRTRNIGNIDAETALEYGFTGPNLRASGVRFDLRKAAPYSIYDQFDFDIPVLHTGDSFDRYYIRILEINESVKIIRQALEALPEGSIRAKVPKVIKPPKGEVFHQIEGAKGILSFYVVSDGGTNPYRLHIHGPSFINIGVIPETAKGLTIQDFISFFASLDVVLGEIDR